MADEMTFVAPTEMVLGRPGSSVIAERSTEELTGSYIWPLFAKTQIAQDGPMVLSRGSGSHVQDRHGRRYLDLSGGVSRASSLGYGDERVASAVYRQLQHLHYSGQGEFQADIVFELAERLATLTPGRLGSSYFSESGTGANEAAFKIARFYHRASGRKPRAYKIIARWGAYHGAIGGPMAASDLLGVRHPSEPGSPGFSFVAAPTNYRSQLGPNGPLDAALYLDLMEQQIVREGPELVAAVIAEPVMQGGGCQIPPPGYLSGLRDICTRHDVLLIADEVITGFGRTGEWFAVSHWDVEPDIMTMAKAMTAGYMPLGAAVARRDIWEALDQFPDVHTYGGHPAAAAAALAVIDIYESDDLIERARSTGQHVLEALQPLTSANLVGEVRGIGMWAAIELTGDATTRAPLAPDLVRKVVLAARSRGLIIAANGSAVELAPRLDIDEADIDEGIGILAEAIASVGREV